MTWPRRIRRDEDDFGFVRNYLDEELCEKLSLFVYEERSDEGVKVLRLEGVPEKTTELYRFFLGRIKDRADRGPLKVSTGPLDEPDP